MEFILVVAVQLRFCGRVDIEDFELLKYMLKSVYGNFGFKRSKTPCIGLNTYTGKKSASYVRPTPRTSKTNATKSEYFRQQFNPMFHPLIHKLVNQLSHQAKSFQIAVDHVYDRFLSECYFHVEKNIACNSENPNKDLNERRDTDSKRFAALSILTAGNDECSGFANMGHVDNDTLSKLLQCIATRVLQETFDNVRHNSLGCGKRTEAALHLLKLYSSQKKIATYI